MKQKKRKILILGAGASIGSKRYPILSSYTQMRTTMPSADNFFYDLFKINKSEDRPARLINALGLFNDSINDFITKTWNINQEGFDPEEWKGVNIEDVMTFLEISSKMAPTNSNEQKGYIKAQEFLLSFIEPLINLTCADQHCEYLMEIIFNLDKKDSIISYNWDTIADFTLQHARAIQLKNYSQLLSDDSFKPELYKDKGLLLKLHGSFNWLTCNNNQCKNYKNIISPFQKSRSKLKTNWMVHDRKCSICGNEKLEPFIIPPTSNKLIDKNSFLKNQWLIAREKLLNATELVFIGYSFPPTDYYSEWLFRQINLFDEKTDIKITVVNPEFGKRGSIVTKRYKTIFRGREIQSFKTLKDYV